MGEDGTKPEEGRDGDRQEERGGYGLPGLVVGLITLVGLCQVIVLALPR
jgi:hypothetical protein